MNFDKSFNSPIYRRVMEMMRPLLYQRSKYNDPIKPKQEYDSITAIVNQEEAALSDKLKTTTDLIRERFRLNEYHNGLVTYHWLETKNRIHELEPAFSTLGRDSTRRISALESNLSNLDIAKAQEHIALWKDIVPLMESFIDNFHQYEQLKSDKELLK